MQFQDLAAGAQFRQAPKNSKYGVYIYVKLDPSSCDRDDFCMCGSGEGMNASDVGGKLKVHFCPTSPVYEV